MKRYFSCVPYGSVPPAEPSEATKKKMAAVRVSPSGSSCDPDLLEISALELVTLDRVLEPVAIINAYEVTPAKLHHNEDPTSSPELHKLRLRASLRGARFIAQIRECRFKSEEEFMNEYYAIARELQLTPVAMERLQWPQ